jgi:hypothetical protein
MYLSFFFRNILYIFLKRDNSNNISNQSLSLKSYKKIICDNYTTMFYTPYIMHNAIVILY